MDRFWAKVYSIPATAHRPELGPCWLWTGALSNGYGNLSRGRRIEGTVFAHVWSWEAENGPVPPGLELDHLCRIRACVRPSHLEAVTHKVNMTRGGRALHHRSKENCPQGHGYDTINTGRTPEGWRYCKQCKRDKALGYYQRTA